MKLILLLFILLLFQPSFCQSTSHNDAVHYYVNLTNNAKEVFLVVSKFANILSNFGQPQPETNKTLIDPGKVDSLENEYDSLSLNFSILRDGLNKIKEIDSILNYKQELVNILGDMNSAFSEVTLQLIKIFRKPITETQQEELISLKQKLSMKWIDINTKIESLTKTDQLFLEKYSITKEELTLNGL